MTDGQSSARSYVRRHRFSLSGAMTGPPPSGEDASAGALASGIESIPGTQSGAGAGTSLHGPGGTLAASKPGDDAGAASSPQAKNAAELTPTRPSAPAQRQSISKRIACQGGAGPFIPP
ncbi:MAG: hypothetical protein U0270_23050 [Labilithrix sp.]